MKFINATLYIRPNGRTKNIKIYVVPENTEDTEIYIFPKDAEYINNNNIKVSLEEDFNNNIIIYFDYGHVDEEREPIELIKISRYKTVKNVINEAIKEIKAIKNTISKQTK